MRAVEKALRALSIAIATAGGASAGCDGSHAPATDSGFIDGSADSAYDVATDAHDTVANDANITAPVSSVFTVDTPNLVRRANIVLGHANVAPQDSMALGNGTLGIATWAANGFTAQLNRADTFPDRKALAQLTIAGLTPLSTAADFRGQVDLYDAVLEESGGGMTATVFVRADAQEIVIDVTGADPTSTQAARLQLWSGRSPSGQASNGVATLAETWQDNLGLGASGQTFGALSAVTAAGRNVVASVVDPLTVQVTFQPNADGSFRVVVAAPGWTGGDAMTMATALLGSVATTPAATLRAGHLSFWHDYWNRVGLVKLTSSDGVADYVEALRTLYLFYTAAESRGSLPGSQAGLADLFDFLQDQQPWFPAGYWVWNLRMQVAANMGAGAFDMNTPVFNLYRSNLAQMQAWTRSKMGGAPGICLPETMRFNGNGYWYGAEGNSSCDRSASPSYNALTLTSGAEVGRWVWQQYRMTRDVAFLAANYPLMSEAAQFLLASTTMGSDGLLHSMANAHETQWDVADPVTNLVAMRALFPAVVSAAGILGTDASLAAQLTDALTKLPALPRTDIATHTRLLTAADDASGTDVFALSYTPAAQQHNQENLDLEAVFPYGLIGDAGVDTALARRTYSSRMFVNAGDWSFDAVDAARLGLGDEVLADLTRSIQTYQSFTNGMALLGGGANDGSTEPYVEELGIVALAVNEALVQDYDGLLRIAPALPNGWNGAGTVFIEGGSKLDFDVEQGRVVAAYLEAGSTATVAVRNPWAGSTAMVVDGESGAMVLAPTGASPLSFATQEGHWYGIIPAGTGAHLPVIHVTGAPAAGAKTFGHAQIGL